MAGAAGAIGEELRRGGTGVSPVLTEQRHRAQGDLAEEAEVAYHFGERAVAMKERRLRGTVFSKATLRKLAGEYAAVALAKGRRLKVLAHARSGRDLARQVDKLGLDPASYVIRWFPPLNVSLGF